MSPIVKRKREKFKIPSKYMLLILTILSVLMMVVTFFTDYRMLPLNKVLGFVVVPLQEGVNECGAWISTRVEELSELRVVLDENQRLKQQIAELTIENTQLQQDKYELNNLRELYLLDQEYSGNKKVGARVTGSAGGNWFHTFTINKGAKDGIKVDMNVIADGGLVGRVIDVGDNYAKVSSIISDTSNVSSMSLASSDLMMVSGSLKLMQDGVISFSQLNDTKDRVQVGDKVVTSQISDKYLPGILIGYISEIGPDANNITKAGLIIPAVDFAHLEEVLVILETKNEIPD